MHLQETLECASRKTLQRHQSRYLPTRTAPLRGIILSHFNPKHDLRRTSFGNIQGSGCITCEPPQAQFWEGRKKTEQWIVAVSSTTMCLYMPLELDWKISVKFTM